MIELLQKLIRIKSISPSDMGCFDLIENELKKLNFKCERINYQNVENKIQAGIFYNVQGKTLSVVSINREPDIYTSPFKSLNLNFTKKFGIEDRFKFNLGFKNIFNSEKQMVTQSHESNEEIYSSFSPGRELYIKLSIDL